MSSRGEILAVVTACAALVASAGIVATSVADRPVSAESGDRSTSGVDFAELIELIESLTEQPATDEHAALLAAATDVEVSDDDKAAILRLVISDLLESPDFQGSRDFYGTPGSREAKISADGPVSLPAGFRPTVPGWKFAMDDSPDVPNPESPRVVMIHFERFAPNEQRRSLLRGHVTAVLSNGGGNPDGTIHIGGLFADYRVHRRDGEWAVDCVYAKDP